MAKTKILAKCLILVIFASTLSIHPAKAAAALDVWEPITPAGASGTFTTVVSMGDYVYLGTTQGIYISPDRGTSWTSVALATSTINAIAIGWNFDGAYSTNNATPVLVATNHGVFQNTFGTSTTWTLTSLTTDIADVKFDDHQTIFNFPIDSKFIFYAADNNGIYRSDDLGLSSTQVSASSTKKIITDFEIDPSKGSVFAITQNNEVYSSDLYSISNNAEIWSQKLTSSTNINDIAAISTITGVEFLATEDGILKTNDAGLTWNSSNTGLANLSIKSIQNDFLNTSIVYAAASSSGVYKSINGGVGGEQWQAANAGLGSTSIKMINTNPSNSTLVYSIGSSDLFRLNLSDQNVIPDVDTVAPNQITSLTAADRTTTTVTLDWVAPGNDGTIGTASNYDIRYSTSTITDLNWNNATHAINEPAPSRSGSPETMTQDSLLPNTTYYFAIKSSDSVPNISPLSTNASITTLPDTAAPTVPQSLVASSISTSRIDLNWSTSTDDIAIAGYKIYRDNSLIATTTATTYSNTGLTAGTGYSYQVSAYDASNNESAKSTSTSAMTQAAPATQISSGGGGGGGGGAIFDAVPPATPKYITTERKDNSIKLVWSNPTDSDLGEMVVVKRESEATSSAYNMISPGAKITIVGTSTSYSEPDSDTAKKLFFYIFARDKAGNVSNGLTMIVAPRGNSSASGSTGTAVTPATAEAIATSSQAISYEDSIKSEASIIYGQTAPSKLSDAEINIYKNITRDEILTSNTKYSIAYFIKNGTPSTFKLGGGERAGTISSYRKAFGHLPKTTEDWMDAIKIGNGRWTKEVSTKAESDSAKIFKKIYGRASNLKNARDNSAIKVMAYGLRPSLRNPNSEKAAIKSFKTIFKKTPTLAADWDIIRTIAYSGATR